MANKYVATCVCGCGAGIQVSEIEEGYVLFLNSDFYTKQESVFRRFFETAKTALGRGGVLREIILEEKDLEGIREVLGKVNSEDAVERAARVKFGRDESGLFTAKLVAKKGRVVNPFKTYRLYDVAMDRKAARRAVAQIDRALGR